VKLTLLFCVKYYLEILIILQKRRRLAFFGCSLEVLSLLLSVLLFVFFHSCQLYFDKRRKTNESKLLFRMNGVESKKSSEIFRTETFIQICESNVIKMTQGQEVEFHEIEIIFIMRSNFISFFMRSKFLIINILQNDQEI
jgi:hypothetical protein